MYRKLTRLSFLHVAEDLGDLRFANNCYRIAYLANPTNVHMPTSVRIA